MTMPVMNNGANAAGGMAALSQPMPVMTRRHPFQAARGGAGMLPAGGGEPDADDAANCVNCGQPATANIHKTAGMTNTAAKRVKARRARQGK